MGTDSRIINIACVLIGIVSVVVSLRLLLRHQYTFLHRNVLTADPRMWVSTFVFLLVGIWVFLFGLIGFIDEKRRRGTNPNR